MFQHATHLPQRLQASDYECADKYRQEIETHFMRGWQFLGTTSQLKKDGDFFTTELVGHPLICWLQDGRPTTFLNVCAHRLCTIASQPHGHFPGRMKCQYHGWEYDKAGYTCKIPDAQSFRPLTKELVRLKQYRTESVGQLLFVSLEESPPPLNEYLGQTMFDFCADWFSDRYQEIANFDETVQCNWKVIMENILETYHIDTMHSKTFKKFGPAEDMHHQFNDYGNEFVMDYTNWGADRKLEWAISKWFGVKPRYDWRHQVRYPNLVVANSSLVTYVQATIPMSTSSTNNVFRTFSYVGDRPSIRNRTASIALKIGAKRFVGKVLKEDSFVYPHIQKGVSAAARPGNGLISVREERIFHFQDYLVKHAQPKVNDIEDNQPNH